MSTSSFITLPDDDATAELHMQQAVGGRPRPSPPSVGAEAPRAAEPTAAPAGGNVAVGSHGEYFHTLTAAAAWCVNAEVSKAA